MQLVEIMLAKLAFRYLILNLRECEIRFTGLRAYFRSSRIRLLSEPYCGCLVEQDRRRIESDFFSGKLCGIAATNALELGIDVGHIDVTLHLGFPGSVARYSSSFHSLH